MEKAKKYHDRMQDRMKQKKYRKNRLSKRLSRWMNVSNSVSVLITLTIIIMLVGALVAILSNSYNAILADKLADIIEYEYQLSDDKKTFIDSLKTISKNVDMDEEEVADQLLIGKEEMRSLNSELDLGASSNFFEYSITLEDGFGYDSFMDREKRSMLDDVNHKNMKAISTFSEQTADFVDEDGQLLGTIGVRLSPDMLLVIGAISFFMAIVVLLLNGIISKIITFIASRVVSRPLEVLVDQMESISNDDLEDAFNREIQVKRPISEVKSLTDSTQTIMTKMAEYYELMTAQNEELEAQRDELESQRDELEAQNHQLVDTGNTLQSMNDAYLSRTLKLQNFLDNVGQGFLTFDDDLIINDEYSMACQKILCDDEHNHELQGQKITEILFDDVDQREFIESLIKKILEGNDHQRDLFMPLLPDEVMINGSIQEVEYKVVRNELFKEQMMVILTDISEKRALEDLMAQERDVLQMIVKVLTNRDGFVDLVNSFKDFLAIPFDTYQEEDFEEVLRTIHTNKGSFSQYYMNNITWMLNEIENELYGEDSAKKMLKMNEENIMLALKSDLDIIEQYVGEGFLEQEDIYTVKEEKIIEIEQRIKDILPATEFNKVMPIIKSIRYKSVKEGLRSYPDYVTKLSERMSKSVKPFEITGEEVFVDFELYQPLFKSLVHVFRNAVDHGIEEADDRIVKDKQEMAQISCIIQRLDMNDFQIVIKDDGAGIDISKVLETSVLKGVISSEEALDLTPKDVMDLIFLQGVTTKESANAISGRGVGLAAVRDQVERLGGQIELKSEAGKGSEFIITLPIIQGADIMVVEPLSFMDRVEASASQYFTSLGLTIGEGLIESLNLITLHSVSAIINIKGSIDGLLVFSVNKATAVELVNAFIIEEVDESEVLAYMEDVIGEVTNTILGNVLGVLEEDGIYLTIGVPAMLSNDKAYIKYMDRQIMTSQHQYGDNLVTISLLITESDAEQYNLTFDIENEG